MKRDLIFTLIAVGALSVAGVFAYRAQEGVPPCCAAKRQLAEAASKSEKAIADSVQNRYNYLNDKNKETSKYDMTFLEFGAVGCKPCQMMEEVMKHVKENYPRINVVFMNVSKKEFQPWADYFKIEQIPTQVLLDKSGKEYFRHVGYYSFEDLSKNFKK